VWRKGSSDPQVIYFTNRIEIGSMQQSERLRLLHEFLENQNKDLLVGNLQEARELGLMGTLDEKQAFNVTVECRVMDQMGKYHTFDQPLAQQSLPKCSYIKLINVPSPCDISGTLPDPTDGSLSLTMIDHATLNLVSKFTHRTHLTADLSHTNPGEGSSNDKSVAVGNYDYDDGSQASILEQDSGRILDQDRAQDQQRSFHSNNLGAGSANSSLNRRINQPNSAIN